MAPRIALALVLHNHQPVGNFGWVIEQTFRAAYEPMVAALERHPHVRVGLHYTGPLLEWLSAEQPDFVDRLAGLAQRGQVELLGGGWTSPSWPPCRCPTGSASCAAWATSSNPASVADRAAPGWPNVSGSRRCPPTSSTAATSGRSSTTTICVGRRSPRTPCGTRSRPTTRARRLTVFGTEQGLRYRIPFGDVDDVVAYLRDHATEDGRRVA